MKILQFFETKSKQGKIALSEDLKKKLESVPDLEIDDVFVNMFDQEFLTRERAASDPKVYDKIRAEVLDGVDAITKDYLPLLEAKDQTDIQAEPKTYTKLKMIKDAFIKSVEKIKAESPSNDEKIKELKKNNQELVDKFTLAKTEWETSKTELVKGFEEQKKTMQLDWTLDKKLGEYTFADEYKEVKSTLVKSIVDKVKTENVLILDDSGQIKVHEKTASGESKQKFIGNDAVTLDKLLEEPLKPFLKKNNKDGDTPPTRGAAQGRVTTPVNTDPMKMTLQQRRAAGVRM